MSSTRRKVRCFNTRLAPHAALFGPPRASNVPPIRILCHFARHPRDCRLVARLGLDQELHFADVAIAVEWERHIDVQDVAEPRAGIAESHAATQIAQRARIAVADDAAAPGTADIAEDRGAEAGEPKGVPIGVKALLHGEQATRGARFVAKRITAKSRVAADQKLRVRIERISSGAIQEREQ